MRRDENIREPSVLILSLLEPSGPVQGFTRKIHANLNHEGLNMYCKHKITSEIVKLKKSHQNVWETGMQSYCRPVLI